MSSALPFSRCCLFFVERSTLTRNCIFSSLRANFPPLARGQRKPFPELRNKQFMFASAIRNYFSKVFLEIFVGTRTDTRL